MTTTKALNGLTPSRRYSAGANTVQTRNYRIASGTASNMFTGDVVMVKEGNTTPVTVGNGNVNPPIGVFMGCFFEENGEPKFRQFWPANTSASNAYAIVCDDPQATFEVQCDASSSVGDIMEHNFEATLGAGSTFTGRSGVGLDISTRTSGVGGMFRIIDFVDTPGNDIDNGAEAAFPIAEVQLIHHQLTRVSTGR
jgi:hypothetical protein|tara:strand:- start:143 stop:730 length:588 start_codon:yes stop_codon:yes gene_type:complete